jgi:hypothetical protein
MKPAFVTPQIIFKEIAKCAITAQYLNEGRTARPKSNFGHYQIIFTPN